MLKKKLKRNHIILDLLTICCFCRDWAMNFIPNGQTQYNTQLNIIRHVISYSNIIQHSKTYKR